VRSGSGQRKVRESNSRACFQTAALAVRSQYANSGPTLHYVPHEGFEPSRPPGHLVLNQARLPAPPAGRTDHDLDVCLSAGESHEVQS
jgi:hypothetical protein